MAVTVHIKPSGDHIVIYEADNVPGVTEKIEGDKDSLVRLFNVLQGLPSAQTEPVAVVEDTPEPAAPVPAKRGRKPKNQPDPATASAPPPMPVAPPLQPEPSPAASTPPAPLQPPAFIAPPAPAPVGFDGPAFLDRSRAAAPPPPAPAATTPPPPAPPAFNLGPRIVTEYERRKANAVDNGKGITEWMLNALTAVPDLVIPGASIEKMLEVLRTTKDEKVAHIAEALTITP